MNEDVYGLFEDDRQYNSQTIEFIIRFNWLFKYQKYLSKGVAMEGLNQHVQQLNDKNN